MSERIPIVRLKDEARAGQKNAAGEVIQPCQTGLNPPHADPKCCHPARKGVA